MKKSARRISVLALLCLFAAGLVPGMQAQAGGGTTYDVQIGRFFGAVPAESMRFFPRRITVHQNDVLHFTSNGFHSATLLPVGQNPEQWVQDFASDQDDPWAFIVDDPDDNAYKANNQVLFPPFSGCGAPGNPCDFDGTGDPVDGVLNSGLPLGGPLDFSVQVTASPGDTFWVICLVHQRMRMRVDVVNPGDPASTQAEIDAQKAQQIAADREAATALAEKLSTRQTKHRGADGRTYWDAFAGYDTKYFVLYGMYPRVLNVREGQRVQWHFDSLTFEDHTVTFPQDKAQDVANNSFVPGCDPDGDLGPGPDTPPDMPNPPFCNDPTQLEFDIAANFAEPRGDNAIANHNEYHNSGVDGGNFDFIPDDLYRLRFTKASREPHKYICLIHPFMRGRVRVRK